MRSINQRRTGALAVFVLLGAMLSSSAGAREPNAFKASRVFGPNETSNRTQPSDDDLIYAALGDSYSAGTGAGDYGNTHGQENDCHRSANSYPSQLATHNGFNLIFAACHGAKIEHVVGVENDEGQIAQVNPSTDVVTITIGGNDIGFSKIMISCVANVSSRRRCDKTYGNDILDRIRTIQPRLVETYAAVRAQAEHARIVVVGYPGIMPSKARGINGLHEDELVWLKQQSVFLNSAIRGAVQSRKEADDDNIFFANTLGLFRQHEACTEYEWVHCLVRPVRGDADYHDSFHPKARGHRVLADALLALLLGEKVVLQLDGLNAVDFGQTFNAVSRTLVTYFGNSSDDSGWSAYGLNGAPKIRFLRFRQLFVAFYDGPDEPSRFVGWKVFDGEIVTWGVVNGANDPENPMGLATSKGIGVGSTTVDVRRGYPDASFGCGEPNQPVFFIEDFSLQGYFTGPRCEGGDEEPPGNQEQLYEISAGWPYYR